MRNCYYYSCKRLINKLLPPTPPKYVVRKIPLPILYNHVIMNYVGVLL